MTEHSRHPGDDDLVLLFYGEPDAGGEVAAHVESCEICQASLAALRRTLAVVDRHRIPEREAGYGGQVWARVQDRLEKGDARGWFAWLTPRRVLLAGGLAVLLIAAFVAGRFTSRTLVPELARVPVKQPAAVQNASAPGQVRERVLLVAVGDHLERSQMVLVELMNRPADGPVDITAAQEWARDLVPTNRLIRETADQANEPVVADVLGDLERVLVEIANSPSELSGNEFEQVRRRIESQGLVFKIRVLDSQVRERERTARPNASTRS